MRIRERPTAQNPKKTNIMNAKMRTRILDLTALALEANRSADFNIFLNFSGHVDMVSLRISTTEYGNIIFDNYLYYPSLYRHDHHFTEKTFYEGVDGWERELRGIIAIIEENEAKLESEISDFIHSLPRGLESYSKEQLASAIKDWNQRKQ